MFSLQKTGGTMPLWKKIFAIVSLLILVCVIWFYFFRTDENTAVVNRVKAAAEAVSFRANTKGNTLQSLTDANSIGEFVMSDASVMVNLHALPGSYDFVLNNRAEIVSTYAACRAGCADLTCDVSDFSVEFLNEDRTRANVKFIATGKGYLKEGKEFHDFRNVSSVMVIDSEDGEWRFAELKADCLKSSNESTLIPTEF